MSLKLSKGILKLPSPILLKPFSCCCPLDRLEISFPNTEKYGDKVAEHYYIHQLFSGQAIFILPTLNYTCLLLTVT